MILKLTIKLLCDNGDYDCTECGHRAVDIEKLVKVVEAAKDMLEISNGPQFKPNSYCKAKERLSAELGKLNRSSS